MVTATFYYNTGFNAVNIPASPAVLEAAAKEKRTLPVMDIIQLYHLGTIAIKATEADIVGLEYVKLSRDGVDAYYLYLDVYSMTSADVVVISISMDPLLTLGGFEALSLISGSITRLSTADVIHKGNLYGNGNFDWQDPLFSPIAPRSIYQVNLFPTIKNADIGQPNDTLPANWPRLPLYELYGSSYDNVIDEKAKALATGKTTINKTPNTDVPTNDAYALYTYNHTNVPAAYHAGQVRKSTTKFSIKGGAEYEWPGTTYYIKGPSVVVANSADVMLECARELYGLGVPNVITDSYAVPGAFFEEVGTHKYVGKNITTTYEDKYIYATNNDFVKKYLIAHNRYKLIALGTGQTFECDGVNITNPLEVKIHLVADISPFGAPYYYLDTSMRTSLAYGAVRGATWGKIPVSFGNFNATTDIQSLAVRQQYAGYVIENDRAVQSGLNKYQEKRNGAGQLASWIDTGVSIATDIVSKAYSYATGQAINSNSFQKLQNAGLDKQANVYGQGLLSSLFNSSIVVDDQQIANDQAKNALEMREKALENELAEYTVAHRANKLEVQGTVTNVNQTVTGNGAMLVIERLAPVDADRYTGLMQMYGFSCSIPVSRLDKNDLPFLLKLDEYKYSFIQCKGASVQLSEKVVAPRSVISQLESLLGAGVRIWATRPDKYEYKLRYR